MEVTLLCSDPEERRALLDLLAPRLPLRIGDTGLGGAPQWIWWHAGAGAPAAADHDAERAVARRIRAHLELGARVLVSGVLARHVDLLADEPEVPDVRVRDRQQSRRAAVARGLTSVPGEPLLARFGPRVLLAERTPGVPCAVAVYRDGRSPARGTLLAVASGAVRAHPEEGVLWTHGHGRGRLLCLGAGLVFANQPAHREARARFCGDLFDWLGNAAAQRRTRGWPKQGRTLALQVAGPGFAVAPASVAVADDPVRVPARSAGALACELWAGATLHLLADAWSADLRRIARPEHGGEFRIGLRFRAHDPLAPVPEAAVAAEVTRCELAPTRLTRALACGAATFVQEVHALRDGFAVNVCNTSSQPMRVAWELAGRASRAAPAGGAPRGAFALTVGADGREVACADDVAQATWSFAWSEAPLVRGIAASDSGTITIEREFVLAPGATLSTRIAVAPVAPIRETRHSRLALGVHDERGDRDLAFLLAKLAHVPFDFATALVLGWHAEASAALAEEPAASEDFERIVALLAWAGPAAGTALWPKARRLLAQQVARGASAASRESWAAAVLVARAMGDRGLERLCAACVETAPSAPGDDAAAWREFVADLGGATLASAAHATLAAFVRHALGFRVVTERVELVCAPEPTAWGAVAFAGLVVHGHELAGELAWSTDRKALEITLLATPLPGTSGALELEFAPLLDGSEVVVLRDGAPVAATVEPLDGATRARVRCRIAGAMALSFKSESGVPSMQSLDR